MPLRPALLVSSLLACSAFAQAPKLAYVDLQRVMLTVQDGKDAKARLQKWLDDKQKEIDKEQQALKVEKEQLEKAQLAPEARQSRNEELQRKVMALAQKWEKARAESAAMERKEMEPIIARIDQAVEQVAEREGIDVVLEKRDSGIVFARSKLDLSSQVIQQYDASRKK